MAFWGPKARMFHVKPILKWTLKDKGCLSVHIGVHDPSALRKSSTVERRSPAQHGKL